MTILFFEDGGVGEREKGGTSRPVVKTPIGANRYLPALVFLFC